MGIQIFIDVPVIHGSKDQIVPFEITEKQSKKTLSLQKVRETVIPKSFLTVFANVYKIDVYLSNTALLRFNLNAQNSMHI